MDILKRWLRAEPINIDGITYIFPHGTVQIRRIVDALSKQS